MCYTKKLEDLGFKRDKSKVMARHSSGVPALIVEVWTKPNSPWMLVYRGGASGQSEWSLEDDMGIVAKWAKFSEAEKRLLARVLEDKDNQKLPLLDSDGLREIMKQALKSQFLDFTDYVLQNWSFVQVGEDPKSKFSWLLFRHRELYDVKLLFNESTGSAVIRIPNRGTWEFKNPKALLELETLPEVFSSCVKSIEFVE